MAAGLALAADLQLLDVCLMRPDQRLNVLLLRKSEHTRSLRSHDHKWDCSGPSE